MTHGLPIVSFAQLWQELPRQYIYRQALSQ